MHGMPRRSALAALLTAASMAGAARAAFSVDGPARIRVGAAKGALLDLTVAGSRLVAVGERGHVLLSDDHGRTWRQARVVPTRVTLTCVHATDDKRLWAAGHGGVIVTSGDAGESWSLAAGTAESQDVLLSIRVDRDGRGLAVGGFGLAVATVDAGKSWRSTTLLDGEVGEKHLNRIFVSRSGAWLIAAEGGHVLRSTDGHRWHAVVTPYRGSLWTGLQLPGGALLVGGMRGNVVRSTDDGLTWAHSPIAQAGSFTGAAVLADARPVLVGVDGTLAVGNREGTVFELLRQQDRVTLTGIAVAAGAVVASTTAGPRVITV